MSWCVNCNIRINVDRLYDYNVANMGPEIITIIEEWSAQEIFDEHHICHECINLVMIELNNRDEGIVGQRQLGHLSVCVSCGISINQRSGRRSRPIEENTSIWSFIANLINPRQIPPSARACNACWQWARLHQEPPSEQEVENDILESPSSPLAVPASIPSSDFDRSDIVLTNEHINLTGYSRTLDTSNNCFVPECINQERLRVPLYLKKKILTDNKLYVTPNARVCEHHLGIYNWEFLEAFEFTSQFSATHITQMLDLLRKEANHTIDFENVENMSNSICIYWTGLTIINFLSLLSTIHDNLASVCRKPKTALGLYLMRLRTGEPIRRIASLICISKSMANTYVQKARKCLVDFYVPLHLGVNHISRESLSSRNLLIPQGLFGTADNNPILICDGTYVYIQKSSNYLFQKLTYSLHKYSNLLKPFLIVASDGHILDVYGPYAATTSDATIMQQLFQDNNTPLRQYLRENDILILDRGFRDAIPLLSSLGYSVYKPESLSFGETQLSTIKANKSRMVTMSRWVVEVVNGWFKRDYKIFRHKYFNVGCKNLMNDFKIAAAIINNFHPALTNHPDAQIILNRACQRINLHNYLADYVIGHNLNRRRANFVLINGALPQLDMFPVMEMSDLTLFSLGIYQIQQAKSYYGEHIRANGSFIIEVSEEIQPVNVPGLMSSHETVLIRGRIKSRHISHKIYYTYILLNVGLNANWDEKIRGYYCSCLIGKRTLGSCAHVMTIVWYLGWARHQANIVPPAQFLDDIIIREDFENDENE